MSGGQGDSQGAQESRETSREASQEAQWRKWRSVADLYHAYFTGLILTVVTRRGTADAAEFMFRVFRRQQQERFLPGLQKLGINLQTIEAVLGHVGGSRSGIVGIYQRHSFDPEKRSALEAWGAHVMALVEGRAPGKVVAFGGR